MSESPVARAAELALQGAQPAMTLEGWATLGVIFLILAVLASNRVSADIVIVGGVTLLLLLGILTPATAFAGMSNEGMLTVAILFVVAAGLQETGATSWFAQRMLGRPRSLMAAQARIILPAAGLSAFLNNTPIVAMMIPAISEWARKHRLSASKLMIPLSYAAIFGGTCTLIGTSTNLVVSGLWLEAGGPRLGLFSIAWIGVPCMVAGTLYLLLVGRYLLPDRKPPISETDDPRAYTVEMMVDPRGPLVGQSIEEAGLRNLAGVYLAEIDRDGEIMAAVAPTTQLRGGDRLVFVGVVDSIVDLQRTRGLTPATDQVFKLDAPRSQRSLIEAVVSDSCAAVGKSVRDARFRSVYDAVVIAVARNGERIVNVKIGDIVLRAGDTLLLEARPSFVEQQRNSRDFFLVSRIENSSPPRHEKALLAAGIFVAMILLVTVAGVPIILAAMVAAGAMIVTRCLSGNIARSSVDWQVLIVIAASFALGRALRDTGSADVIARHLIGFAAANPWVALLIVYGMTTFFTEIITNNAAAVIMFPIAHAASQELGVDFTPFAFTIMMGASASFSTPIGYQTNLMVLGPGGYRFTDYAKVGLPLNLTFWAITVLLAPLIWPF